MVDSEELVEGSEHSYPVVLSFVALLHEVFTNRISHVRLLVLVY